MKKVCVLGANGFIGQSLVRENPDWMGVTRQEVDFLDQQAVETYFQTHIHFDVVIHCAVVGGSRLEKDDSNVTYKNILMFENVVRVFHKKLIYFSSGAALRGNPPTDPYGLSKWIIDHRISTIEDTYSLRIWGAYGPGELPTRFSAVCRKEGHVVIDQDRYFDFIDIKDIQQVVRDYVDGRRTAKECNLTYTDKCRLSEWAEKFGATWEIRNTTSLGPGYISTSHCVHPSMPLNNDHVTGIKKAPTAIIDY